MSHTMRMWDPIQQHGGELGYWELSLVGEHVLVHSHPLLQQVPNRLVDAVQHRGIGHHVNETLDVRHCNVLHAPNIGVDDLVSLLNVRRCDIGISHQPKDSCSACCVEGVPYGLKEFRIQPGTRQVTQALVLAGAEDNLNLRVELARLEQLLWWSRKKWGGGKEGVWHSLPGEASLVWKDISQGNNISNFNSLQAREDICIITASNTGGKNSCILKSLFWGIWSTPADAQCSPTLENCTLESSLGKRRE